MKVEVIGQQIPQQEIDAYIARAKEIYPNKIPCAFCRFPRCAGVVSLSSLRSVVA